MIKKIKLMLVNIFDNSPFFQVLIAALIFIMLPFIFLNYIEPLHSQLGDQFEIWQDWLKSLFSSPYFQVLIIALAFLYILRVGTSLLITDKEDPDFDDDEKTRIFLKRILSPILQHRRFFLVLFIGICELNLIYYFWVDLERINEEFGGDNPNWLGTIITTSVAAPIALAIWTFRNADKRQDILHAEENIRQADFHKIEEWATTFSTTIAKKNHFTTKTIKFIFPRKITNKIDPNTLQIAAIHQLLPYLKGEHGERFMRPSMEIYRSLLSSWEWDTEDIEIIRKVKTSEIKKPNYIDALHTIFRQEEHFFRKLYEQPICRKNNWNPLKKIDLKGADLHKLYLLETNLIGANLIGADLRQVFLSGANLRRANFREANLERADLRGTNLREADLRGADLRWANLLRTDLREADLRWANLSKATYEEKKIKYSIMDEDTILADGSHWKPPEDDSDQQSN